ncbi:MAG: hypothetical protein CK427_15875 [Leptospira sp.]|nr:MAG: hypothetical protein CK427_15875 [Leptospira sp.]
MKPLSKDIPKGSIRELIPIALPIFVSQAIDVLMVFSDRFFLSRLSIEDLAATLSGGILQYVFSTLVLGTMGQITALSSQYIGAKQKGKAIQTVYQGLILSFVFAPILILISRTIAYPLFEFFGHEKSLLGKELEYYSILSFTIFTMSLRTTFASFFIGIGKTIIVTLASFSAVLINLPLTYALVFGKFGFPALGIKGAALGTLIASMLPIIILSIYFYSKKIHGIYNTRIKLTLNVNLMKKLVRYGLPSGIEMMVNVSGFMFFTMVMYSYSADVAAATTIVLNWDMVSFIPLLGIGQAVGGQVGKYLGEGNKEIALKSAYSALILGVAYSILVTILYISFTHSFVSLFAPDFKLESFQNVLNFATVMLRISCLYLFFDCIYTILGGILRGAGDTIWVMIVSNLAMWICASIVYYSKNHLELSPIGSWWMLTGMVMSLGILYAFRFFQKAWLNRLMIDIESSILPELE